MKRTEGLSLWPCDTFCELAASWQYESLHSPLSQLLLRCVMALVRPC